MTSNNQNTNLVTSHIALRNLIGLFGLLLPFVLLFTTQTTGNDRRIEPSISDYYFTSNGDLLVVMLCIIAAFLFTYRGYTLFENILCTIAAISAVGVAFSPTATTYNRESFSIHTAIENVPHVFGVDRHFIFAVLFFISMAILCLFFFTRTNQSVISGNKMSQKSKRNIIYYLAGFILMLFPGALIGALLFKNIFPSLNKFPLIFYCETIAIIAFGLSWLTKGNTFFPDGEHYIITSLKKIIK